MDVPSTSRAAMDNEGDVSEIQVKYRYMTLLDEVEGIENSNVRQNISRLNDVLDKANELFPQVKKPSQLYWDAKVLHCSTATLEETCNNLDVGEGKFKLFAFAEQMKVKSLDNEGHASWEVLAAVAQPVVHNSLPYWSPLLGSFDFQADVTLSQPRKERKQRAQKEQFVEKKEPEKLRSVDKTHEGIEEIIRNIYAKLKTHFKRNGKRPIGYFRFVMDPKSFSSTVENIFHVSFLINDGFVKMELEGDEPVIFPVSRGKENSNPETERHSNDRQQNIFSIDMKTWRGLVAGLKVTEAMI